MNIKYIKTLRDYDKKSLNKDRWVEQLLWKTVDGKYYVSSACRLPGFLYDQDEYETMVFRASPTGYIDRYDALACVHFIGHNEAIKAAGFDIVEE